MRERLKVPRKGSEIEPETICLQVVGGALCADCVLFVERACELQYAARLSCVSGAEAKASLNRAP